MKDMEHERDIRMLNPPHLGKLVREIMNSLGCSVTEAAKQLECDRVSLSRLLNGKSGVSAKMALALEKTAGAMQITGCECGRVTNSHRRVWLRRLRPKKATIALVRA